MGVFPARPIPPPYGKGLPHTRGGVSHTSEENAANRQSSPHPWGCFQRPLSVIWAALVFPTPVGVFPIQAFVCPDGYRLPHTRGGVSGRQDALECCCLSSPHPWGCFSSAVASGKRRCVFPTPVGVFLFSVSLIPALLSLPHTRGGVSWALCFSVLPTESSPHPWGCFLCGLPAIPAPRVFPTPVGVFLAWETTITMNCRLPHTRGGVSQPSYRGKSCW